MRSISAPWRESVSSARSKVRATASSSSSSTMVVGTASRMPLIGRGCSGNDRLIGEHSIEHRAAIDRARERSKTVE